jgi:hypothetical protein
MYFSTSGGREVTTKRQLDGLCNLLKLLGLQIWISEMLQYHPELEVVELVQDEPRFFWDHLLPTAHVNSFPHLERKSTQVRIMGITNCPMHNNDGTQCVGLVSTNQDNFLGPHKKHLSQVWFKLVNWFRRRFLKKLTDGRRTPSDGNSSHR